MLDYDNVMSIALRAIALAQVSNHTVISLEHLLYALLEKDEIKKCLKHFNIDENEIQEDINIYLDNIEKTDKNPIKTKEFELVIGRTVALAPYSPRKTPNELDILFQLIHFPEISHSISLLIQHGLELKKLKKYILQGIRQSYKPDGEFVSDNEPTDKKDSLEFIKKYCVNLNELATLGKIDPVIGRLSEIDRIVQILARRTKNNVALVGDSGVGKAQPLYSNILTKNGWKKMGDIKLADGVITPNGSIASVTGIYPQGIKDIWKIIFSDGSETHCCDEHLWKIYNNNWKRKKVNGIVTKPYDGWKIINTKTLKEQLSKTKINYFTPLIKKIDYSSKNNFELNPYVLGVLLGDGSLTYDNAVKITSADNEIISFVSERLLNGYELKQYSKYIWNIKRTKKENNRNDYCVLLEILGLSKVSSETKHIPQCYFFGSYMERLELLQGLLDTDGTVSEKTSAISFATVSLKLAKDVQSLVRSIGGLAKLTIRQTYYTYKGIKKAGKLSYRVSIRHPEPNSLFKLTRKLDRVTKNYQYSNLKNHIEKIEYVGKHEAQCIMIDDINHLYITDDYIVTHNTAIAEGLAFNIVQGNIPELFKNSIVWSLDINGLVAGTRFRGDFEERMKYLLKAFSFIEDEQPIIFIDEIHTIMDAGNGNKGSLDVSNILKPALARGKLRCIGSTTDVDWRKSFEKDRALLRRFKKLSINEPSIADAKLILKGLQKYYEDYHGVSYTDAALNVAVDLSAKYLEGRLPDKAIDLIDEAGSRQRISETPKKIITDEDIKTEVSHISKIPQQMMDEDESLRLQKLESDLKSSVFGQDKAILTLVNAVMIARAGLREINKPEGCFLFTGPTGVGKTEMARQLAKCLTLPLIKFDISEYQEKHMVSKFIGSPPGYVGFGEGNSGEGLLINAIDSNPSCVLLLDEIEKAHPDVFNVLLQVMDDAILTSSSGKPINFRNVILIMTSNAGVSRTEQHGLGFLKQELVAIDEAEIKRMFSPEFRNRLDAIVEFSSLDRTIMIRIVLKFIAELQNMVKERDIDIEMTDAAKKWLAEKGYDAVYGARPLSRLITEKIKQPLSREMLFGNLKNGGILKVFIDNGNLAVQSSERNSSRVS